VQILISVPKKRFKHAVDRNRVKRQIREAYRRHKQLLHETLPAQQQLLLAFVWLSDRHLASAEMENRVQSLLRRIVEKEGDALTTRDS
jgi:ribonuclease P protein component